MLLDRGALIADRFAIEQVAGSGGMAVVYRATDQRTGQPVAVKVLKAAQARAAMRFTREAVLLAQLQHPNIVSYVAHGVTAAAEPYLVMEWLEGEDLGQRLATGVLTLRESLTCLGAAAAALALAHRHGVIHRDLKPSNLFLRAGEVARTTLLDFGVAKSASPSQDSGAVEAGIGTPLYMSPEQARGEPDVGPSADIFSIGCVLYECLTGWPPFKAAHAVAVLARILSEEALPVRLVRPELPVAVEALLGRMLAKDPRQRLQDAGQLLHELAELAPLTLTEEQATAAPLPHEPAARWLQGVAQGLVWVIVSAPSSGDRQALTQLVRAHGGHPQWLLDGSLIVTVSDPQRTRVRDCASAAARCALALNRQGGIGPLALSPGRALAGSKLAGGEAVEYALSLLRSQPVSPHPGAPGEILVDRVTAALLGRQFTVNSAADVALLGEERAVASPGELPLNQSLPVFGRDGELSVLASFWQGAVDELEPSLAIVSGPPGIGKTRLSLEFRRRLHDSGETLTVLEGRAEPSRTDIPYGLLEQLLSQAPRLVGQSPPGQALKGASACPDRLPEIFLSWLRAETEQAPVLLILDDLQWADSLSIGTLGRALRQLAPAPLLVLALGRPNETRSLVGLWPEAQSRQLVLKGLSAKACERLINQRLGRKLKAAALTGLIELSGGNPLFLEELIEELGAGDTLSDSEVLIALLQARLDGLPYAARRAVLTASLFGQSFQRRWLAACLGDDNPRELETALRALEEAEFIEIQGSDKLGGDVVYGFRSELVRNAAYRLLTGSDRRIGAGMVKQILRAFPPAAGPAP